MTSALGPQGFRAEMERRILGRAHSSYPTVQAIANGTATPEQIAWLGVLFYHFTKHTPMVLSSIHARCLDPTIRRRIMDTLIDEDTELRCGSASHHQLAMDFVARFAGMSEDDVEHHPLPPFMKAMIDYRYTVARDLPVVIALGNSGIASESHAPEMVRLISDGLREHYGVKDEDQESWIVHIEGDKEHGETGFKTVIEYCVTPELQQQMFWCIDQYLAHWGNFWRESEAGRVNAPNLRRIQEQRMKAFRAAA